MAGGPRLRLFAIREQTPTAQWTGIAQRALRRAYLPEFLGDASMPSLLVHNVYFSLKDKSAPARDKLLTACRKYLTPHPGIVFFACGILAEELKRDVNDRDFDVGLHIAFESQAAHDRYQTADLHTKFVEENRGSWSKVRVFDTLAERA
jgi:hypothetical protein